METIKSSRKELSLFFDSLEDLELGSVFRNKSLSEYSRWKIGGIADCIICPRSINELSRLMMLVSEKSVPYIVVGGTSNLLFDDEGVRVLVIVIGEQMSDIEVNGGHITAQSGIWVPKFSKSVADSGLTGTEHMIGIPGTLGGLVCMNGGSQRKGVGEYITKVTCVSPEGNITCFSKDECEFSYRTSIFQENRHIVASVEFHYPEASSRRAVKAEMLKVLRERRRKFPKKIPNCGSVFISDPALYEKYGTPGSIIESCGLKGVSQNGAQISPIHANFIVNNGGASAKDVLYLIGLISHEVKKKTGYSMPAEVRYVDSRGNITPAHKD